MGNTNKETVYCPECGEPIRDGQKQCSSCGYWFEMPETYAFDNESYDGNSFSEDSDWINPTVPVTNRGYSERNMREKKYSFLMKGTAILLAVVVVALAVLIFLQEQSPKYEVVLGKTTWTEANEAARNSGGSLAVPKNQIEFDRIVDLLRSKGIYPAKLYLGLSRVEGTNYYYWIDKDGKLIYPAANSTASWSYGNWRADASALKSVSENDTCGILFLKENMWVLDSVKDNALKKKADISVGYIVQY